MDHGSLLRDITDVCERLGLTHFVTGSTATIAYGEPRFTNDIDIVIALPRGKIDEFCAAFPVEDFYLNRDAVHEAVHRRASFNLIHPASGLKVDVFVLTESEFDKSRINRRRQLVLNNRSVSFASPEDVIIKKMLYYHEGGSPKHIRDIAGVLRVQSLEIDQNYITRWANAFGIADIWRAVREGESQPDSDA